MKRTTIVSLGLFATWAIGDLEELWTMSRMVCKALERVPRRVVALGTSKACGFGIRRI